MSGTPFRVVYITRRHVILALFVIGLVIGVWQGLLERPAGEVAPVAGERHVTVPIDEPVRHVSGAVGRMSLTINVDWGNEELLGMLKVLEAHGVKATFFLTGRWAAKYPDLARLIAEKGHEIGNHGLSHAHPTQLSKAKLTELIVGNVAVLQEAAGVTPVPLFAPPYGEQNAGVVQTAASLGHWTTLWTLDTIDWQNPSPRTITGRVVPKARDGAIVLMHPKPQTLEALPSIIDGLVERGFTLLPLWRMMGGSASP